MNIYNKIYSIYNEFVFVIWIKFNKIYTEIDFEQPKLDQNNRID